MYALNSLCSSLLFSPCVTEIDIADQEKRQSWNKTKAFIWGLRTAIWEAQIQPATQIVYHTTPWLQKSKVFKDKREFLNMLFTKNFDWLVAEISS